MAAACCAGPGGIASAAEPEFQILRGVATGGIWVELASDNTGRAELAILDGMPDAPPTTSFVTLTPADGPGCALEGEGGQVRVSPCPTASGRSFSIRIGALDAQAVLAPINPQTSFAWPADLDFSGVRSRCMLPTLSRFTPINGTPLAEAVQFVAREAAAINPKLDDARQTLPGLRVERHRLYALINFSPEERRRYQELNDAIAGRPVMGRTVSLAEAAQMRERFDREVLQNPARVQARLQLQQVERSLSEIYNVQALNQSAVHRERLVDTGVARLSAGLADTLATKLPRSLPDAITLEGMAGEIDQCLTALGEEQGSAARLSVQMALAKRSDEIADMILSAVRNAASADAARSALAPYEANATIIKALQDGGRGQVMTEARNQVAQRFAAEDRAQQAAARQAQIDASRNQVAVSRAGGASGGRLNVAAVQRSVYFIYVTGDESGSGTGFAVSDRHIVTNVHVVAGATKIYVVRNGGTFRTARKTARVVEVFPSDDLAVLEVDGLGAARLPVATGDPAQGTSIWAMGYMGVADEVTDDDADTERVASLSEGIITRVVDGKTGDGKHETRLIQHSANTGPGNSGSPIFDACNRVVGVHNSAPSGKHADRAPTGISASVLAKRLKELGIPANFSGGGCSR